MGLRCLSMSLRNISADERNRRLFIVVGASKPVQTDFTNVPLETDAPPKKKREPRRILHFSDGILEEYSTDEEDEGPPPPPPVDPKTLTWGPWTWHYMKTAAWKSLSVADTCGEHLAWFLGITTPKYQSAIDEFYRLKAEEDKEKAEEERFRAEMMGLSSVDVTVIEGKESKGGGDEQLEKF